jgi:hypothetical protein
VNADFIEEFIASQKRKDVKAALQLLLADPELISEPDPKALVRARLS